MSVFLGVTTDVQTQGAGALAGNGSLLNPLGVIVDGATIEVNGSNELQAVNGGNPFDQDLNTFDSPTFAGVTLGNDGLTVGTPQFSVFSWEFSGFDPSADPLVTFVQDAATFTTPLNTSDSYGEFQVAHLAVATVNPTDDDPSYNTYHGLMGIASTPSTNSKLINEVSGVTGVVQFDSTGNTVDDGFAQALFGSVGSSAPILQLSSAYLTNTARHAASYQIGVSNYVTADGADAAVDQYASYNYLTASTNAAVGLSHGSYVQFSKSGGATVTTAFGAWVSDMAGQATNPYYDWFDSRGVFATREEFSQAVPRLYNPEFAKYTPGAVDYERIFLSRWGQSGDYGTDNIGYLGAEAGGTGTLRTLNILGAHLGAMSIPGTYTDFKASAFELDNGGALRPDTTTGHKMGVDVYDVNGAAYKRFIEGENADVPKLTISQPSGGALLIMLPTSDPGVPGALWNNAGTPAIS